MLDLRENYGENRWRARRFRRLRAGAADVRGGNGEMALETNGNGWDGVRASAMAEENRLLAQKYLALEESSRREVAKLKAANDRLMHGESHMRRLLDEAALGFALLNRDLCLVSANKALCGMIGYSLHDLSGMDFRQYVYASRLAAFARLVEHAARDGGSKEEMELVAKSGAVLGCRLSATPWLSEQGEREGTFVLVADISGEIGAAARVRDMRRQMRESEKTRSVLLDIIGHEMRSSASGMLGMTRLLLETALDARQRELSGVIHSSANALLNLVDNLTEMAALETDGVKLRHSPLRTPSLCAGVMELFNRRAEEKGVTLHVDVPPAVPDVIVADAGRLRRVLTHLVDNAIKFTDRGRVTLSVDAIGDNIRFMVSDTGRGLDPETSRRLSGGAPISEPLGSRRSGGLGVGLSICRRLVALMGGRLGFESAPGKGSEFHFTVPLVRGRMEAADADADAPPVSAIRLPRLSVLVAEANPLARKMIRGFLQFDDHRLTLVDNGMEAAEKRRAEDFDVMILDMQMPGLDGAQTLRVIRDWEAASGRKTVPAVALTASALAESPGSYSGAGFAGFLVKPVRPVELMSAIAGAAGVEPLSVAAADGPAAYAAETSGGYLRRIDGSRFTSLRQVMLDDEFASIFRFFMEDAVPGIIRLGDMAGDDHPDRERIAYGAGKARGMASYLGFSALSELLGKVEGAAARGESVEALRRLTAEIAAATDDSLEELKRIYPPVFATLSGAFRRGADAGSGP